MPAPIQPRRRVRVLLSSTALLPFLSVRKAAALAIAQLGVGAFFLSGITQSALGESAGWFVLGVSILAAFVRAIDIESWALLIPGGFVRRVRAAFGRRASPVAAAVAIVERLLLAALASVVVGHYAAGVAVTAIVGWRFTGHVRAEDLATVLAVLAVSLWWMPARLGRHITRDVFARGIWIGIAILLLMIIWGLVSFIGGGATAATILASRPPPLPVTGWALGDALVFCLIGIAVALPCIGGGETMARAAQEMAPPRVQALKRTASLTVLFGLLITTAGTFLVIRLVPADEQAVWLNAPLAGLAQHLAGPLWARDVAALAVVVGAVLVLIPAAHASLADAEQMLYRLAGDGTLPRAFGTLHVRFGTPARAVDAAAAAVILIAMASGGRVTWLARATPLPSPPCWC